MSPILTMSRRVTLPCDMAFTISRRLSRAFVASRTRVLDALRGRYTAFSYRSPGDALCRLVPPNQYGGWGAGEDTSGLHSPCEFVCRLLLVIKTRIDRH